MPFSFNPTTQANPQDAQAPLQGGAPMSSPDISLNDAPAIPDTPFLFLQQRSSGNITVNAYLQLLLLLVCVLTVISAITLFAYGMYLSKSIESKKELLAKEEATFTDYPFDDMKMLSERIIILDTLLKDYVSIRSPLKLLESVVENRAYFDNFTLAREKKGGYIASFDVITNDYQSLIQQLDALKLTEYTKIAPQPKAEKLLLDKKQNLTITVTTPVMIQGVLPDEVLFLESSKEKTNQAQSVSVEASSKEIVSTSSAPQ